MRVIFMAAVILLAGVVQSAPVVSDHAAKSYTVYNGSTATARMTQTGDLQGSGSLKMSGTTRISSTGVGTFSAGTTINGGTAWHSGNDGAGSGLDADLLDGFGSDDFATTASDAAKLPLAGGSVGPIEVGTGSPSDYLNVFLPDFSAYIDEAGVRLDDVSTNGFGDGGPMLRIDGGLWANRYVRLDADFDPEIEPYWVTSTDTSFHGINLGVDSDTSGTMPVVSGGWLNKAGSWSSVGGGQLNIADDGYNVIAGGYNNLVTGYIAYVTGGKDNSVSGYYAGAGGLQNTVRGYAAQCFSDYGTIDALTGGGLGGGHNYIHNKGANIEGPYSGADGADSGWLGGAYTHIWALRSVSLGAFEGRIFGDYSAGFGNKPLISDTHDGAFVFKGTDTNATTDTTGVNQALFFPDSPASGGQMAIKGQPLTTATLTVWGPVGFAGSVSTTGTATAAGLVSKGARWHNLSAGIPLGYIGDYNWTPGSSDGVLYSSGAGPGECYFNIDQLAGTVISRIRVQWENPDGTASSGVKLQLLRRDASSTASAAWTTVGTQQTYTNSVSGLVVSTYDLSDHTMLDNNAYAIGVTDEAGAAQIKLYSVGYETTTRIY